MHKYFPITQTEIVLFRVDTRNMNTVVNAFCSIFKMRNIRSIVPRQPDFPCLCIKAARSLILRNG